MNFSLNYNLIQFSAPKDENEFGNNGFCKALSLSCSVGHGGAKAYYHCVFLMNRDSVTSLRFLCLVHALLSTCGK